VPRAKFSRKMQGNVAGVFGDKMDVDWHIISFETLRGLGRPGEPPSEEVMGKYCMVEVDPEFPNRVQTGDFIVAGRNFGYGHDHDGSCKAILGAGVPAVICESSNGNFIRNSVHHGLPIVEVPGITKMVKEGDKLELDLEAGTVKNLTNEEEMHFSPYPDFLLQMIESKGLYEQLEKQLKG
jgi:3-isopropylmalate/(R)-2-methylmalate dehydratase small subunit